MRPQFCNSGISGSQISFKSSGMVRGLEDKPVTRLAGEPLLNGVRDLNDGATKGELAAGSSQAFVELTDGDVFTLGHVRHPNGLAKVPARAVLQSRQRCIRC